jgi:hypothetical protein
MSITEEVNALVKEVAEKARLKEGDLLVIGCSTSAVQGELIGTHSSIDLGAQLWQGVESAVKELFYTAVSPRVKMVRFNGSVYDYAMRISEMDMKQMSEFIDNVLTLIEKAPCFRDLVLTPDVRHCWVHNITKDDLHNLAMKGERKCPEYLEYRRKQCCIVCGRFGCEAHHIRETEEAGVARKADDWETISLCQEHHRMYHTKGQKWLNEQIGWILKYMTLEEFCAICFGRWKNGLR